MRASLHKRYDGWALVVDEQELRRLADECRQILVQKPDDDDVTLQFEVRFSDGLSFVVESLDDVLAEENPRSRSIVGLEITAKRKTGATVMCRIGLESSRSSSLTVAGPERQAVYVGFSRIEERLRRMMQWHARSGVIGVGTGIVAAIVWYSIAGVINHKYPALRMLPVLPPPERGNELTLLSMLAVFGGMAFALLIGVVARWLFPDPVFRIGDGSVRHDRVKSARSKLLWMILAAGILAPLVRFISGLIW